MSGSRLIDTHIHLWDIERYLRRDWLEDKPSLVRSFLPAHVKPSFDRCGISSGIIVEAAKYSHEYNLWWLSTARDSAFIDGAVLGAVFDDPLFERRLDEYRAWREFLGYRIAPPGEPAEWAGNAAVVRGLDLLQRHGAVLELLVGADAFAAVAETARRFPDLTIVLDHLALPPLEPEAPGGWEQGIGRLARCPNVFMKYSGFLFVTRGTRQDGFLERVCDLLLERFGPERMMWGSNYPVDTLWNTYEAEFDLAVSLLPGLGAAERDRIFGGTAERVFRLPVAPGPGVEVNLP